MVLQLTIGCCLILWIMSLMTSSLLMMVLCIFLLAQKSSSTYRKTKNMKYSPELLKTVDHCQHRSFITNRYTGRRIAVNCGQCDYCIHKKAQKASMRVKTAGSAFEYCWFVTLTYDNKHIPLFNCEVYYSEYDDVLSDSGTVYGYENIRLFRYPSIVVQTHNNCAIYTLHKCRVQFHITVNQVSMSRLKIIGFFLWTLSVPLSLRRSLLHLTVKMENYPVDTVIILSLI